MSQPEGAPTRPPDATPPPPPPPLTFPEYGQGGDYAGQRRSRRAFRYAVCAVVAFVVAVRVYDGYFKLELDETQYVNSLTLQPASARPILRHVVKVETEKSGKPIPLYVEALAGVEEDDKILPTYEEAARLGPNNPDLLIKFGCELFQRHEFEAAREKFREAGVHPPRNALPNYLEAAALAASLKPGSDLSEPLAIIARANNSGAPLRFPTPLWHPTLPKHGEYYAEHRRDLARRICAPLSQLKQFLAERARHDIEGNRIGDWDQWLSTVQEMGRRIATANGDSSSAESTQVMAGINIELDTVNLRKELAAKTGDPTEALAEQAENLSTAMAKFTAFEDERQRGIDRSRAEVKRPFVIVFRALYLTTAAYLLVWVFGAVVRARPGDVTLPHTRLGVGVLCSGLLLLGLGLQALLYTANNTALSTQIETASAGLILALIVFGALYPTLSLPAPRTVLARHGGDPALQKPIGWARRNAGVALARRYFGVLVGGTFIVLAVWVVTFRLMIGLYPDQFELLISGMEETERQCIASAIAALPR